MKKVVLVVAAVPIVGVCAVLFLPESPKTYPAAQFEDVIEIAPLEEALTFARVRTDDGYRLIAVSEHAKGTVAGYDLTALLDSAPQDPISLFNAMGYEALQSTIDKMSNDALELFPLESLGIPADLTNAHVAAGTNFADHADESSVEEGPFLFAKMVEPTPFNAPVTIDTGLLDYEVEVGYVTLGTTKLDEMPEYMGLVATNDFTNRAKLLRALNPDDVTSGDGFTTGKSAPGFMPVGTLFVIPRDYRAFSMSLHMRLATRGELRQDDPMSLMIWDIDEIFRQTATRESTRWDYLSEPVALPIVDGALPARTVILAGTPKGTVFQSPGTKVIVRGALKWLFGGWSRSPVENIIETYIAGAEKSKVFLQPGDTVHVQIDRLGEIITPVE